MQWKHPVRIHEHKKAVRPQPDVWRFLNERFYEDYMDVYNSKRLSGMEGNILINRSFYPHTHTHNYIHQLEMQKMKYQLQILQKSNFLVKKKTILTVSI